MPTKPDALGALRVALTFGEIENAVRNCRGIEELSVAVGPADLDVLELRFSAKAEVEAKVA
jgi:hypothetical protein